MATDGAGRAQQDGLNTGRRALKAAAWPGQLSVSHPTGVSGDAEADLREGTAPSPGD